MMTRCLMVRVRQWSLMTLFVSALFMSLPVLATPAGVAVVNNSSFYLVVTNAVQTQQSITIAPNTTSPVPTGSWEGQTWAQHPYFFVRQAGISGTVDLCPGKHGKKSLGTYTIDAGLNCTYNDNYEPPPPAVFAQAPVLEGVDADIYVSAGSSYSVKGYIRDLNGQNGSLTVTTPELVPPSPANSPFYVSAPIIDNKNYELIISGNVPSDAASNTFTYQFSATSSVSGAQPATSTFRVNLHVQQASQPPIPPSEDAIIPRTISAWLYDASGDGTLGQFKEHLKHWNQNASAGNRITELHTYGTDMEMYGDVETGTLETYYNNATKYDMSKGEVVMQTVGPANVAYYQHHVPSIVYMSPIVDGRTDHGGYLINFEKISDQHIRGYADLLALQICTDHRTNGVQVDVEPLEFVNNNGTVDGSDDLSSANQVIFYLQLTKNLAGDNPEVPACMGKVRFVSVFTFAKSIRRGLEQQNATNASNVMELLQRDNFLVIDSLYDLVGPDGEKINTPEEYLPLAIQEVKDIVALSATYGFNFKFGIPASCSFHECKNDGSYDPEYQSQYVRASLQAIGMENYHNGQAICGNEKFKGIAVWTFNNSDVTYKGTTFQIYRPSGAALHAITHNSTEYIAMDSNKITEMTGASRIIGCPLD